MRIQFYWLLLSMLCFSCQFTDKNKEELSTFMVLKAQVSLSQKLQKELNTFWELPQNRIIAYIDGTCSVCVQELEQWSLVLGKEKYQQLVGKVRIIIYTNNRKMIQHIINSRLKLPESVIHYDTENAFFEKNFELMEIKQNVFLLNEKHEILTLEEKEGLTGPVILARYLDALIK